MAHGLFGKIKGLDFGEIKDIKAAADYVQQKTIDRTNVYRGIISLTEKDALRLGHKSKKDWEKLLQTYIYDIGEKAGIPPSKLEYCAAVHMDKGHPHVHYMLWEKDQGIKKPWISPKTANEIRIDLTKKIYKDELAELYQIKNEARDILSSDTDSFFKSFFEPIVQMSPREYKAMREELKRNPDHVLGELINTGIPPEELEEFATKLFALREQLPITGRLKFDSLSDELKEEMEELIQELIGFNDDFAREFEMYVNASIEIASHYANEPSALAKAKEKAEDEMLKRLSNRLLKNLKQINASDYAGYEKQGNDHYRKTTAFQVILDLFSCLSRENEAKQNQAYTKRQELSKQARKEYAIKQSNASDMDWEDER